MPKMFLNGSIALIAISEIATEASNREIVGAVL
jgi:hypothetical protein